MRDKGWETPWVLDPFSGSGTTLLTAAIEDVNAIGMEVNPFLAFAARAKTTPLNWTTAEFESAAQQILSCRELFNSPLEAFSTFGPQPGKTKWLFNTDILRLVYTLNRCVDNKVPATLRPVFRLAILNAAMACCNAKRDGKGLRYKSGWRELPYTGDFFLLELERNLDIMRFDCEQVPIRSECELSIVQGDARQHLKTLSPNTIDLVVTSPPYLNSFDYTDVYRPELFLGEFITSQEELRELRLRTVRSHVQVAWDRTTTYESGFLRHYIEELNGVTSRLWNKNLPRMVHAYFDDMYRCLKELHRIVRSSGEIWFVVSTSAYGGIEIPVDLLLAETGEKAGLDLKAIHVLRPLRSAGQHWRGRGRRPPLRESLIVWTRP